MWSVPGERGPGDGDESRHEKSRGGETVLGVCSGTSVTRVGDVGTSRLSVCGGRESGPGVRNLCDPVEDTDDPHLGVVWGVTPFLSRIGTGICRSSKSIRLQ